MNEPVHLFTYGTLLDKGVMRRITGEEFECSPGLLHGYERKAVKGASYPGIRPRANAAVSGVVYWEVTPQAFERIDDYEGDLYERRLLEIQLADGRPIHAYTYVVPPHLEHHLSELDWKEEL